MWFFKKKKSIEVEAVTELPKALTDDLSVKSKGFSKREKSAAKKQEKEKLNQLDKEVRELYSEPDGTIPDLTVLERARGHRLRNVLIGLTFFFAALAAAAWAGFFIFKPFGAFNPNELKFTVEAPASVKSGEEAVFVVRYAAGERLNVRNLEISVKLPDEFEVQSVEPLATGQDSWRIGSLAAGGEGKIVIRARVIGAPGSLLGVRAFADYVPADFSSPFQNVASAAFTIAGSTLDLTATSTDRVLPGEPVRAIFAYKNNGAAALANAAFRIILPAGFVAATSSPAASEGSTFWKLGPLAPGVEGKIALNGTFASEAKGDEIFTGELGYLKDNNFITQISTSTAVSVIGGDLVLTTIVNGSATAAPVSFGDTLLATISYANKSEAELGDVKLTMRLQNNPVKSAASTSITEASKGATSPNAVTWTKKEVPSLAKLAPGAEGSFDVSVKLSEAPYAAGAKDYSLDLWTEGLIGTVNGADKNRTIQTAKLHFPFFSDLSFKAESRYYNDDEVAVGTGPLPPKVGSETTYRIFLTIENALHDLKNLSLATKLPDNVRFTGKKDVSAGDLKFDEATHSINWTLNRLPASVHSVTIDFEVALTPGAVAAGNILPLTGDIRFDAEDAVAGGHIIRNVDPVDTSLEGDPLGRGKGVVTK